MKKAVLCALLAAPFILGACSFNATLMARDSGHVYHGELDGNGMGAGTMTVDLGGTVYQGPAVRVASNDTFGFASTYGFNNHAGSATSFGSFFAEGDKTVKALMSSPDGRGLRCDIVGRSHGGGGICVDDGGKVYDVVLVRK